MIPHLHISKTLSKISWAPGTTNYSKINPINIWQNSTIATGSLLICYFWPHNLTKKIMPASNNAHFTSHHLKMVSCCVQFSTAIVITAKGFLSTLLRFCSHSCSMSLQDNLKFKKKNKLKKNPQRIRKVTHFVLPPSQSWLWQVSFVSLCYAMYFLVLNK